MSDDSSSSSVSAVPGACRMPGVTCKPSAAPLASAIAVRYMYGTALAWNEMSRPFGRGISVQRPRWRRCHMPQPRCHCDRQPVAANVPQALADL